MLVDSPLSTLYTPLLLSKLLDIKACYKNFVAVKNLLYNELLVKLYLFISVGVVPKFALRYVVENNKS